MRVVYSTRWSYSRQLDTVLYFISSEYSRENTHGSLIDIKNHVFETCANLRNRGSRSRLYHWRSFSAKTSQEERRRGEQISKRNSRRALRTFALNPRDRDSFGDSFRSV